MPVLAGWLTGEHVPQNVIEAALASMESVIGKHGGEASRIVQPGMGLVSYAFAAHAAKNLNEPPVLDWTPDRRTFVYRRPLSGIHGLYYIENWPAEGNLLFASEIRALLAVGVPRKLHLPALSTVLQYGYIPAPWTAFKDICIVPAGSILRWQRGKTIVNTSTDFQLDESLSLSHEEIEEQLDALLHSSVDGLLPTHTQLVSLVSSSDASLLATLLAAQHTNGKDNPSAARPFRLTRSRHRASPFSIAHYGYKNFEEERAAVETVAHQSGIPLLTVTGVDQPDFWTATITAIEAPAINTRPLALHQLLHMTAMKNSARVALTGSGASILVMNNLPLRIEQFQAQSTISPIFTSDIQHVIKKQETWEDSLYARKLIRQASKFSDDVQQRYYLNLHVWLPDALIHPMQQLAVQEGMAIRSPYLNSDVIDMFTRLPVMLKDGTPEDTLLRKLTQKYLPDSTSTKHPSSLIFPMQSLQKAHQVDASDILRQTLSIEVLKETGIFDVDEVTRLLQQQEVSKELMLVFTTQLMMKMFGMNYL